MPMDMLAEYTHYLESHPRAATLLAIASLLAASWVANWLTSLLLTRVVQRLVTASSRDWDDVILERGVLQRLARLVPLLVLDRGIDWVPHLAAGQVDGFRKLTKACLVVVALSVVSRILDVINELYQRTARSHQKPIKGYLQVAKIVVGAATLIVVVAVVLGRSPVFLLSGLGAMTAVLMLIFQDTILSLVASVQLTSNDMIRVGDWIEMPQLGADGDVVDIALHTVKVQNWDKTITTIPTHRLIKDSFRNWRGMQEAGGRRIRRSLYIDQSSVRFLDPEAHHELERFALLGPHLARKAEEVAHWNQSLGSAAEQEVNQRRLTNLGCFRAYVQAYLEHHPRVHQGMSRMVRQQPPGAEGLPLEIYCFTATTVWAEYEGVQADIFDHLLAILPEFGLRVFQSPAGTDIGHAASQLGRLGASTARETRAPLHN